MMSGNNKYMWLSLVIISILFIERVTVADIDDEEPITSSLYGPNDHVTILNNDNFNRKVYNKVSNFIIKLYQ